MCKIGFGRYRPATLTDVFHMKDVTTASKFEMFHSKFILFMLLILLKRFPNYSTFDLSPIQRITGGRPCDISQYPYLVQVDRIIHVSFEIRRASCGGSLITFTWILTAAHCVEGPADETMAIAGTSKSYWSHLDERTTDYVLRKVTKIVPHPHYAQTDIEAVRYDIAVLKVQKPFPKDNPVIKVAKLPPSRAFTDSATGVAVVGWGQTNIEDAIDRIKDRYHDFFHKQTSLRTSRILQCAHVPLIKQYMECKKYWPEQFDVNEDVLCALVVDNKDAGHGDSGGPIIYKGAVIGLVSLGLGNGINGRAGIYTRVDAYLEFLKQTTRGSDNDLKIWDDEDEDDYTRNDDHPSGRGHDNGDLDSDVNKGLKLCPQNAILFGIPFLNMML